MQLNQMPHDREPESESAVRASGRAIRLSKTFKHVWQKLSRNAWSSVAAPRSARKFRPD